MIYSPKLGINPEIDSEKQDGRQERWILQDKVVIVLVRASLLTDAVLQFSIPFLQSYVREVDTKGERTYDAISETSNLYVTPPFDVMIQVPSPFLENDNQEQWLRRAFRRKAIAKSLLKCKTAGKHPGT